MRRRPIPYLNYGSPRLLLVFSERAREAVFPLKVLVSHYRLARHSSLFSASGKGRYNLNACTAPLQILPSIRVIPGTIEF